MTRRAAAIALEIAALALAALLGAGALLVWGLGGGGMDSGFLRGPAESVFARAFADQRIEIGRIESEWLADARAVRVTAHDMTILDVEGREEARAARLSAVLPAAALIGRSFRPRFVEAEGGVFTVMRDEDGRIGVRIGPPPDAMPAPAAARGSWRDDPRGAALSDLRGLALSGATLFVADAQSGLDWRIEDVALDFRQGAGNEAGAGPGGLAGSAQGLLVQQSGPARIAAEARSLPGPDLAGDGQVELDVRIEGVNGTQSGPSLGPLAPLRLLDAPADAALRVSVRDGALRDMALRVTVGEGALLSALAGGSAALNSAQLDLFYEAAPRRVTVEAAHIDSELGRGGLSGRIEGPGADDDFAFDLTLDAPVLGVEGFAEPPSARAVAARGVFRPQDRSAALDALDVDLGFAIARLSGSVALAETGGRALPSLRLSGPVEGDIAPADVLRYWPLDFAAGGRDWIADHVQAGRVHDAHLALEITPETIRAGRMADEALTLSFRMDGAAVRYAGAMPPLTDGAGSAVLRGNSFALEMETGRIGDIALTEGFVTIPRLNPRGALARFGATARGAAADMVGLLDHDPLNFPARFGVDPASIGGQGAVTFTVSRPMRRHVPAARIGFTLDGAFEGVAAPGPAPGFALTDGRVALQAEPGGLTASGPARIGPVEAEIAWREDFFSGEAPGTRFSLDGALDQADFDALGAPLRAFLDGHAVLRARTLGDGLSIRHADVEADLSEAALSLGAWSKPSGAPGSARFALAAGAEDGAGLRIDDIALDAAGLELRARAALEPDGRLALAEIAPLRVDSYADLNHVIASRDGEALVLSVEGAHLDVSDLLDSLWRGGGEGGLGLPLRLDAQIGEIALSPAASLTDSMLSLSHDGDAIQTLSLDALTHGEAVRMRILPSGGGARVLEAGADDAGLLVQALFGAGQMQGGQMRLSGVSAAPGAPWRFDASMTDFTLVEAPILARVLSLASLSGFTQALSGGGMPFTEFRADALAEGGRITISDGRAEGPSLGVSVAGAVDLSRQTLSLDGAVAPASLINQALGDVLGAPRGEGLFAFAYRVDGPFAEPQVSVNPLSGLTPGFLRRIFDPIPAAQPPPDEDEPVEPTAVAE